MEQIHDTTIIQGRNKFKLSTTNFEISPLSSNTNLYINSIANGVINPKSAGETKAVDTRRDELLLEKTEDYKKIDAQIPDDYEYSERQN